MNTALKYIIGLDLLSWHATFRGDTISRFLEMPFEMAIFGNFPDIPKLKLSLPLEHIDVRMWRWVEVCLAELLFLYFFKPEARRSFV